MGGEITWECQGNGQYKFKLKIYRDCNGPSVSNADQTIRVWNNQYINSFAVHHISAVDISPVCTPVAGSPSPITCSTPINGASEQHIFESDPVTLNGIPPAQGWVFTWDNFSRNAAVTNLMNPSSKGVTIRAVMYGNANDANPCFDSSPQFEESPTLVVCAGNKFTYNPAAYDPDLDSLVFSFGNPLDRITTAYTPPTDPAALLFETGYSLTSPLPNQTFNASNVPASLNADNGELTFRSYTQGTFVLVMKVESYRNGFLISEVYREMQIAVISCSGTNTPPVIIPPFNGNTSFKDTVTAGDLVTFSIQANDAENLQDGSPQTIALHAISAQFGASHTDSSSGCTLTPCAILSSPSPVYATSSASMNFEWQTNCNHVSSNSISRYSTYNFIFKAQDDYCQIPGITYATVSITVLPMEAITPPEIKCVNVLSDGSISINWGQILDESGTFESIEILASVNGTNFGVIDTITDINQTNYIDNINNGKTGSVSYILKVNSGCSGKSYTYSDTVSSIFLNVNNPGDGTAILQWNPLATPNVSSNTGEYRIFREYPKGVYTHIATNNYGNEFYIDTITICSDSVWYFITTIDQSICQSASNFDGDEFEDLTPPKVPVIYRVTIDTSQDNATVEWNPSTPNDVEGYIILKNVNGNWVIVDTVNGQNNTFYTDTNSSPGANYEQYGIAVFDSCWKGSPASPNTSAMGTPHKSVHVNSNYTICDKTIKLTWNKYINWEDGISKYKVFRITSTGGSILEGSTNQNDTSITIQNVLSNRTYCFVIEAISNNGKSSISNKHCLFTYYPNTQDPNYTQTLNVLNENSIEVVIHQNVNSTARGYEIYRSEDGFNFNYIDFATFSGITPLKYTDADVHADDRFYFYKNIIVDSCGTSRGQSNISKSIFLTVKSDQNNLINSLEWNAYQGWDGAITRYNIYRSVDGVWSTSPIGTTSPSIKKYEDDVSSFLNSDINGEFCYYIEAEESLNTFLISETSKSNEDCGFMTPFVHIPNSFSPNGDGINDAFLPSLNFVSQDGYIFRVFNRWSHKIFTTSSLDEPWDGTFNGKSVPNGVYVYTIEFNNGEGKRELKTGHVNLIR